MVLNKTFWDLPCSSNIRYFWNFGSILGLCLITQIFTGLILTFFYTSFFTERFNRIIYLLKEIWWGWLIRFFHMNGASIFFFFLFLHMFRGIFFFRTKIKSIWFRGIILIVLLMMTSFLGYVLPWGQISYWAVAVITNLFSVIPIVGNELVLWIWGGFSVNKPTLIRFYSLHFVIPIVICLLTLVHLRFLHRKGSRNNIGINSNLDKLRFHPYFSIKDKFFIYLVYLTMIIILSFNPLLRLDPINNIPANPLQTPIHIQPEWYFLTFYAILRSMPRKTTGVLGLVFSILVLAILRFFKFKLSPKFRMIRTINYWLIVSRFLTLMKLGSMPAEEPFVLTRKIWTRVYFLSILTLNL